MSKPPRYRVGGRFVMRAPVLPYAAIEGMRLEGLLARGDVSEAIALASPALQREIGAWREAPDSERGRGVERALVKYVARMATRATPFGLFAGVSVGAVGKGRDPERLEIAGSAGHRRRTRVDNDVLFAIAARIARTAEARERLTFRPNSSLTAVAGRLRYAEARAGERVLSYHLVAVEPTPYLTATIERARGGARLATLAAALAADDPEVTLDDAAAYVAELADAQVLVPELGVAVTGPEPIDTMIAQLASAGLDGEAAALSEIRAQLQALDAAGLGAEASRYTALLRAIGVLHPDKLDPAKLFQVDLAIEAARPLVLGADVVAAVQRGVEVLRRITPRAEMPQLVAFRRSFVERWEDREVPLALVLDEEAGIGFAAATGPGSEGSPLLADLPFPVGRDEASVTWGRREAHLLARLHRAVGDGATTIELDDGDLRALTPPQSARLPDALAAMIRIGRREGVAEVLIENAHGPSGARVLGRFCHLDGELEALVRDHLDAEARLRPDAVFAEIVHLADGRNGNILCRPVLREHEIVYLGIGGAAAERQIGLDDLLISVRGDRVVLRSRSLDREVVPRLTSAHNVQSHGLGVYRFLHALSAQDGQSVAWSWGPLRDAPFLPRVCCDGVVLERAQWCLDRAELAGLRAGAEAVAALRARRRLPRYVVVADGDNEQWVDLDEPRLVDAFVDAVAGREGARLLEVFPAPDAAVVRGPEGSHACEVVLTLVREPGEPVATRPRPRHPASERRFAPGSRWLYLKLYGGVSSADRVLREAVAPLVRDALASGAARRWFFLRYSDPAPHLRVRLDGDPARLAAEVLPALDRLTAPLLDDGSLVKVGLDTYQREVERYGGPAGIELVEELFWHDSEAALAIVEALDGDEGNQARWLLALRGANDLLVGLGLDAAARAEVYQRGRDSLAAEHAATPALRKAIGERYRAYQVRLDGLLGADRAGDADDDLAPGLAALADRDRAIGSVAAQLRALDGAGTLAPTLVEMAWSLVHMSCNRLLHASPRAQELVIYDLLRRQLARRRALGGPT